MNWEYFLNKEKDGYYTQFLMHFISLIVIILYFYVKPKTKPLRYLAIIAISSFIEGLTGDLSNLIQQPFIIAIGAVVTIIYLFIEITCCLFYIRIYVNSHVLRKIMSTIPFIFISYMITILIIVLLTHHSKPTINAIAKASFSYIYAIEGFLIITACLYFFYELFVRGSVKEKISTSVIWAISGMLLFFGSLVPFSLFVVYFVKNNTQMMHHFWPINYVSYSILFITFSIAFISDKKIIKPEKAL